MASTNQYVYLDYTPYVLAQNCLFATSENSYSVFATLVQPFEVTVTATFTLQRKENGAWVNVMTKSATGYRTYTSGKDCNVEFANISNTKDLPMRVKLVVPNQGTFYSATWTR